MVAYAEEKVVEVVHEHIFIVRVRAVQRIGKPEILPDHYPVPVAGFIEFIIHGLPYPVAYHCEVLLLVQTDSGVVFFFTVAQVEFAESPVASAPTEPASVYPDGKEA